MYHLIHICRGKNMLDSETKKRIDTARDILVGKIPDPKSQVEQITIALIYKFMDDMDKESIDLGGKTRFFSGEFAKYSWNKIFDSRISGFEMFGLYSEAITKMNQNPNIPQLFRDIFKNAYLPYRDPETLKDFLKIINEFKYDHSEKLGDAFEYLLSVTGSQGEVGQFRTPRHIIDFIVEIIAPTKNENILDPACGTAGFLISAYKYILKENRKDNGKTILTPDEKKRLNNNFIGYDISPDMVRLSLVNLYLHGFQNPHIHEYDTLTSEEKWNEKFDIILANPPFMTPKGGIKPHKKFSIQANRSEVLFVDYIAEHLNPNGRAGIIVPEGIIFQSNKTYTSLRKKLLDTSLYAIISLPSGVFNPYSGVKTSILLLDKQLAKKTDKILFIKIENDGYHLGAKRKEIIKNDLPKAITIINKFKDSVINQSEIKINEENAIIISKEKVFESEDYNLTLKKYKDEKIVNNKNPMLEIGELCEIITDKPPKYEGEKKYYSTGAINENQSNNYELVTYNNKPNRANIYPKKEDVGFAVMKGTNKVIYIDEDFKDTIFSTGFSFLRVKDKSIILPKYLYYIIKDEVFQKIKDKFSVDGTMGGIRKSDILKIKIPILEITAQEKIIKEIEKEEKIINENKKLVEIFQQKINNKMKDIWGEKNT